MKKLLMFLVVLLLLGGSQNIAGAYNILDPANGEANLYEIFNQSFSTDYTSSMELWDNHGLSNDSDDWWQDLVAPDAGPDELAEVSVTIRYAGYGQALGIEDAYGNQTTLVSNIQPGGSYAGATFNVDYDFMWVETLSGSGSGQWYSDDSRNGGVDHFHAFDVSEFYGGIPSWMIAFEDLPDLGDRDYNDLVALVHRVDPAAPVPEPATMLLLGTGLVGLAGFGRKKLLK